MEIRNIPRSPCGKLDVRKLGHSFSFLRHRKPTKVNVLYMRGRRLRRSKFIYIPAFMYCSRDLVSILQWTFCLGSILVMGASGWFYLLTKGTRLVMYIPAIMSGAGTSIMYVTTLALAAEFVDTDRVGKSDGRHW
jgi:hypothetical protein